MSWGISAAKFLKSWEFTVTEPRKNTETWRFNQWNHEFEVDVTWFPELRDLRSPISGYWTINGNIIYVMGCNGRRTNSMICVLIKKWNPYNFYQKRGSSLAKLGSSRPLLGSPTKNLWHRFVQNLGIGFWIPYFRTHSWGIENPRIIISWVDGWVDDIPMFADRIPMLFGLVETCQTLTLVLQSPKSFVSSISSPLITATYLDIE
jgi:hypothetical protein